MWVIAHHLFVRLPKSLTIKTMCEWSMMSCRIQYLSSLSVGYNNPRTGSSMRTILRGCKYLAIMRVELGIVYICYSSCLWIFCMNVLVLKKLQNVQKMLDDAMQSRSYSQPTLVQSCRYLDSFETYFLNILTDGKWMLMNSISKHYLLTYLTGWRIYVYIYYTANLQSHIMYARNKRYCKILRKYLFSMRSWSSNKW